MFFPGIHGGAQWGMRNMSFSDDLCGDVGMERKRVLVLGVGNVLLRDEGIGVRVVERLRSEYDFSENVELLDGGTLGLRLLDPIANADCLIVVDAVQNGRPPGTLYRMNASDLGKRVTFKNSLHQLDLLETLAYAEVLGNRPDAVLVGVEPADISPWGIELTEEIAACLPELCSRVLREIESAGGSYEKRAIRGEAGKGKGFF